MCLHAAHDTVMIQGTNRDAVQSHCLQAATDHSVALNGPLNVTRVGQCGGVSTRDFHAEARQVH